MLHYAGVNPVLCFLVFTSSGTGLDDTSLGTQGFVVDRDKVQLNRGHALSSFGLHFRSHSSGAAIGKKKEPPNGSSQNGRVRWWVRREELMAVTRMM